MRRGARRGGLRAFRVGRHRGDVPSGERLAECAARLEAAAGSSVTFGADVAAAEVEVNARRPGEGSSSDAPIAVTDVGVVGDGDGEPAGRVSSRRRRQGPRRADQTIELGWRQTRQRGSRVT